MSVFKPAIEERKASHGFQKIHYREGIPKVGNSMPGVIGCCGEIEQGSVRSGRRHSVGESYVANDKTFCVYLATDGRPSGGIRDGGFPADKLPRSVHYGPSTAK
jgi:hypothetical protein